MASPNPFDALAGGRYVRLSTFRRSGDPVPTPVWFARLGENLYVVTGRNTGKVKRIRNNPDVTLAPSDFRGRPKGRDLRAVAGLTDEPKGGPADRALRNKYGWQYRVFELVEGLRGATDELVFLELRPPAEKEE
ncbi:MAG: PPOX class F420-dependent oxidoreductase [Actinomycetota bacterium]|nr:PPOX class F420-dependent oxidoreductase [Actinomycetota bacterium]